MMSDQEKSDGGGEHGKDNRGRGLADKDKHNLEDWSLKKGSNKNKRTAPRDGSSGGGGLPEENLLLRRHLRKQEEKIKLLATKLVRVVNERKNKEKRDEMLIEEQKGRILELEGVVTSLSDKLSVSRHQLATYTKLIPVPPRMSMSTSGKSRSPTRPPPKRAPPPTSARSQGQMLDSEFTARVEQLLLEAKGENGALEDALRHSRAAISSLEAQLNTAHRHLAEVESAAGEELASLRSQLDVDENSRRKERGRCIGDNIQLIRLQRESRRSAAWCSTLESQLRGMEEEVGVSREKGAWLQGEVARLEEDLRAEQTKALSLGRSLEEAGREVGRLKEVEMSAVALIEENRILKENHDSLLEKRLSSVSLGSRGGSRTEVQGDAGELQRQLVGLEASLKEEVQAKAELGQELREERRKSRQLLEQVTELEGAVARLNTRLAALEAELETKRQNEAGSGKHLLAEVEEELGQTKWQLVQVRDELDKTRSLLKTQMTISKEWGREVEELTKKLDRAENVHQSKLGEFMTLLEQRTVQMVTLESTWEAIRSTQKETTPIVSQEEPRPPPHPLPRKITQTRTEPKDPEPSPSSI